MALEIHYNEKVLLFWPIEGVWPCSYAMDTE